MGRRIANHRLRAVRTIRRSVLAILAGIALGGAGSAPPPIPAAPAESVARDTAELESAWQEFEAAIADGRAYLRQHPFYRDAENRAPAHAFLAAMMLKAIEHDIVLDPDFPYFRLLDFRLREGGDNPDQTYFMAPLRGGVAYRIWGRRGSERRLDFQTYSGSPYAGSGKMAGFLDSEDLKVAADGTFEVMVSPDRRPGNWLPNPADGTQVLVRQVFSDWRNEKPGELHIDRIGAEGVARPAPTDADMARRLRAAAQEIRVHLRTWPETVARGLARTPANTISVPFDAGPQGGVPGRWMARGNFELGSDEALVIRTWAMPGNYQGIQLADLWFSSLEYGNRQTSLTGDQAHRSADGSYWFVVSARDPGIANWLDTTGRSKGVILLRFDGMRGARFAEDRYPRATKVRFGDLAKVLPPGLLRADARQRAAALAERREHLHQRLGR